MAFGSKQPELAFRKEFIERSKRAKVGEKNFQSRVLKKLDSARMRIGRKVAVIEAESSALYKMLYELSSGRKEGAYEGMSWDARKKLAKDIGALQESIFERINAHIKEIELVEALGKKVFEEFRPTSMGRYKELQVERQLHQQYKTLINLKEIVNKWMNELHDTSLDYRDYLEAKRKK
ncbi:MAG: hypothetical protein WC462_03060 [archaeon]